MSHATHGSLTPCSDALVPVHLFSFIRHLAPNPYSSSIDFPHRHRFSSVAFIALNSMLHLQINLYHSYYRGRTYITIKHYYGEEGGRRVLMSGSSPCTFVPSICKYYQQRSSERANGDSESRYRSEVTERLYPSGAWSTFRQSVIQSPSPRRVATAGLGRHQGLDIWNTYSSPRITRYPLLS